VLERADLVRNWEVTVGGMGTVTDALATDAVSAVATIVTDAEATAVDP
jgi:phytoene dehydrogenase-like protein